jgi:hypothetical protein
MPTTTNYGWTTPADTDLVKDGASAIRTLGTAIDTTVFNNASAAIAKTIVDAKGDIIAATAADTVARLAVGTNNQRLIADSAEASGLKYVSDTQNTVIDAEGDLLVGDAADTLQRLAIGTTGQVLTADTTLDGKIKWADAPSSSQNWTLVNTGGTSMSGSAAITVSGITGADKLMVCILQASGSGNSQVGIRINNDSTSDRYNHMGLQMRVVSPFAVTIWEIFSNSNGSSSNKITLGEFSSNAASQMTSTVFINGGNSSGVKPFQINTGVKTSSSNNAQAVVSGGWYTQSNTISSIVVINDDGSTNFDAGTLYVFKSA